jgi:hypothetical protein
MAIGRAINSKLPQLDIGGGIKIEKTLLEVGTPTTIRPSDKNLEYNLTKDLTFDSPKIMPLIYEGEYTAKSTYLKRQLSIQLSNQAGDTYTLEGNKMSVAGSKYIGIQQDQFTITLQNISFARFAKAINNGYLFVRVYLGEVLVFFGKIKALNTARDNIVEKTIEMVCLTYVTDLLSDLVSPITVNSGANIWAILQEILDVDQERIGDTTENIIRTKIAQGSLPEEFQNIEFEEARTFSGYKKTIVDDIIKVANDQLSRTTNTNLPWIDYTYEQDGIINLFSPYAPLQILNLVPGNGLIDAPTVNEAEVSFNAIFKEKLVPGRVVKINNALLKTLGNETAFIYGFDPNGLYVITEVRYSFRNYANEYTVSCKARPLSKYNNFTASLGG